MMTWKEKLTSPSRVISGFFVVFLAVAVYSLLIAPAFSDAGFWSEFQQRLTHNVLEWGICCVVVCAIWLLAIRILEKKNAH